MCSRVNNKFNFRNGIRLEKTDVVISNIDLLQHDHRRAKVIETTLKSLDYVNEVLPVETNIVIFSLADPTSFVAYLKEQNILCSAISANQIRFVTHLQFTDKMLELLVKALLVWK